MDGNWACIRKQRIGQQRLEIINQLMVHCSLLTAQAVVIGIKGNNEYFLDDMLLAV